MKFNGDSAPRNTTGADNAKKASPKKPDEAKSPGAAHAAIAISAGMIGAAPAHEAFIPGSNAMQDVGNVFRAGEDIIKNNLAELGILNIKSKAPDGSITVTLAKQPITPSNTSPEMFATERKFPVVVPTGNLEGWAVSGHFKDVLNIDNAVVPESFTADPVEAYRRLLERKRKDNNMSQQDIDFLLAEGEELRREAEAGQMEQYDSIDTFAGTMNAHLRDIKTALDYKSIAAEYNLTPVGVQALSKVLTRVSAEHLLPYYITELFGSEPTPEDSERARAMFELQLKSHGMKFIARILAVADPLVSRGLGHSTKLIFNPIDGSVHKINPLLPNAFQVGDSVESLDRWPRQVTASICIAIDKLADTIQSIQSDPDKLAYFEHLMADDTELTKTLAIFNNMHALGEAALKHKIDRGSKGMEVSLEKAILDVSTNNADETRESLVKYAERSAALHTAMGPVGVTPSSQGNAIAQGDAQDTVTIP